MDAEHPVCVRARATLHKLGLLFQVPKIMDLINTTGGCTAIPAWGKFWLSLLNCYDWDGNNPVPPELWRVIQHFSYLYSKPGIQAFARLASFPSAPLVDPCANSLRPDELSVRCPIQNGGERFDFVFTSGKFFLLYLEASISL